MTFLEAIVAIVVAFLGGGAVVAFINSKTEQWKFKAQRKAAQEDRAEEKADKTSELSEAIEEFKEREDKENERLEEQLKKLQTMQIAQSEALKLILLDRILYLGQHYVKDGEIGFDDRKRLHAMHDCYHAGLNGNGDAKLIMDAVDELPLKK